MLRYIKDWSDFNNKLKNIFMEINMKFTKIYR